jgi:hypothetical protein
MSDDQIWPSARGTQDAVLLNEYRARITDWSNETEWSPGVWLPAMPLCLITVDLWIGEKKQEMKMRGVRCRSCLFLSSVVGDPEFGSFLQYFNTKIHAEYDGSRLPFMPSR